jgi:5-methylcytosine-specific restriction endonuclease McrA
MTQSPASLEPTRESTPRAPTSVEPTRESTPRAPASVEPTRESMRQAKIGSEFRSGNSRYIPRGVLREVYARDLGQCTFVSADGRRCAARGFLQVHHHDIAYARGGKATAENLRIACRAHNLFFARRDFGHAFMQTKLTAAAARKLSPGTEQG